MPWLHGNRKSSNKGLRRGALSPLPPLTPCVDILELGPKGETYNRTKTRGIVPGMADVADQAVKADEKPWAVFRFRDVRLFCFARVVAISASNMQNVAIAWFVYDLTHSAWALGL